MFSSGESSGNGTLSKKYIEFFIKFYTTFYDVLIVIVAFSTVVIKK